MSPPTRLALTLATLIGVAAAVGTLLMAGPQVSAAATPRAPVDANGFVTSSHIALIPRTAPDHVMRMQRDEGSGRNPRYVVLVKRHGDYRREERVLPPGHNAPDTTNDGRTSVEFFNIATAHALRAVLFADGAPSHIGVSGGTNHFPLGTTVRTERTEDIAGERCTIWRAEPADPDLARRGFGLPSEACVTADNIVLGEYYYGYKNARHTIRRAISVERRSVAEAEVRPEARYFDWRYWSRLKGTVAPTARAFPLERYDVTLTGVSDPFRKTGDRVETRRGFGDWTWREEMRDGARAAFTLLNSHVELYASYEEGGTPSSLSVGIYHRVNPARPGLAALPRGAILDTQVVLGERCETRETMATSHSTHTECRTADGLTLVKTDRGHHLGTRELRATRVERGRTTPRSVAIPPDVIDRARWGW